MGENRSAFANVILRITPEVSTSLEYRYLETEPAQVNERTNHHVDWALVYTLLKDERRGLERSTRIRRRRTPIMRLLVLAGLLLIAGPVAAASVSGVVRTTVRPGTTAGAGGGLCRSCGSPAGAEGREGLADSEEQVVLAGCARRPGRIVDRLSQCRSDLSQCLFVVAPGAVRSRAVPRGRVESAGLQLTCDVPCVLQHSPSDDGGRRRRGHAIRHRDGQGRRVCAGSAARAPIVSPRSPDGPRPP